MRLEHEPAVALLQLLQLWEELSDESFFILKENDPHFIEAFRNMYARYMA